MKKLKQERPRNLEEVVGLHKIARKEALMKRYLVKN